MKPYPFPVTYTRKICSAENASYNIPLKSVTVPVGRQTAVKINRLAVKPYIMKE